MVRLVEEQGVQQQLFSAALKLRQRGLPQLSTEVRQHNNFSHQRRKAPVRDMPPVHSLLQTQRLSRGDRLRPAGGLLLDRPRGSRPLLFGPRTPTPPGQAQEPPAAAAAPAPRPGPVHGLRVPSGLRLRGQAPAAPPHGPQPSGDEARLQRGTPPR